ncbi:MAG TPA: hypothetical protein VN693_00045 [Rhodanobacteraceae bacterium]|nr:hypothetical protein [Rhodanobacteraceae bacterium]
MSYSGGWRPHLEGALSLDLRRMFKARALWPGCDTRGGWQWTNSYTGEQTGSIGYHAKLGTDGGTLTLDYKQGKGDERKVISCTIRLVTVPCHYGGWRWLFVCPYTGKRALVLYKWNGIDWFCHRNAIRPSPTYASQRRGGSDRIMAQRWAIRRKLGDDFSTLFDEPFKPRGMHWRTFQRYAARDAALAAREGVFMTRMLGRLGAVAPDEARALAEEWGS